LSSFDVTCNCFPTPFDKTKRLFPWGRYVYSYWCPDGTSHACTSLPLTPDGSGDNPESILLKSNYSGIENDLYKFINQDPNSNISYAALKMLFYCSKNSYSDYASLKDFYLKESKLDLDMTSQNLVHFLVNKCDIGMKDYPKAISWFNSKINSFEGKQDSIYSIIDLEYLSVQMKEEKVLESSKILRSGKVSNDNMTSLGTDFRKKFDYLIPKLFDRVDSVNMVYKKINENLKEYHLSQNQPNPFKGETTIKYTIPFQSHIQIIISDIAGKKARCIDEGIQGPGSYEFSLNCSDLTTGCYILVLYADNKDVSRIKMMVLR
jgi:hypothetical protein